MKICLLLLLALYGAFASNVTMLDVRDAWLELIKPLETECMCQSHSDPQITTQFQKCGTLSDDPFWKCQWNCLQIKSGLMSPSGEVDAVYVADTVPYVTLQIAQKCTANHEPDLCVRSFQTVKCAYDELAKQYPPQNAENAIC